MSKLWPYLGFQHPFTNYFRVHQGQNRTLGTSSKCAAPWREHRKTRSGSWSKTWAWNTGCQTWILMWILWWSYGSWWQTYGRLMADLWDCMAGLKDFMVILWRAKSGSYGFGPGGHLRQETLGSSPSICRVQQWRKQQYQQCQWYNWGWKKMVTTRLVPSTSNFHTSWEHYNIYIHIIYIKID